VATKVQIQFFVEQSNGLTADEKTTLTEKLANRITKEGFIMVECGETRSQLKNKELCTQRLFLLLENALKKDKKRIATKIPKSVIKKRLEDKQRNAEKKQNRKFRF
ncbi:MAG TPA: hypothetical protein VKY44_01220, partial [Flavobacterium sp.]|nr:hypothetical protein [Flavobacterium sp.]